MRPTALMNCEPHRRQSDIATNKNVPAHIILASLPLHRVVQGSQRL